MNYALFVGIVLLDIVGAFAVYMTVLYSAKILRTFREIE